MSQWISEVRSLAYRLRKIDVIVEDEDVILVLTMGLPPSFDNFIVALDATDSSAITLENVISRLLNEESRQSFSQATTIPAIVPGDVAVALAALAPKGSKSIFSRTAQSGQHQSSGTSSHAVPAGKPSRGAPLASP